MWPLSPSVKLRAAVSARGGIRFWRPRGGHSTLHYLFGNAIHQHGLNRITGSWLLAYARILLVRRVGIQSRCACRSWSSSSIHNLAEDKFSRRREELIRSSRAGPRGQMLVVIFDTIGPEGYREMLRRPVAVESTYSRTCAVSIYYTITPWVQ